MTAEERKRKRLVRLTALRAQGLDVLACMHAIGEADWRDGIAAERERCAAIAERYGQVVHFQGGRTVGCRIADEIRKGAP